MKHSKESIRVSMKCWQMWTSCMAVLAVVVSFSGCGGTSAFVAQPAPTGASITHVLPNNGSTAGGTLVYLIGSNIQSGATVTFGGTASPTVTFQTTAQITAVTPPHVTGTADIVVTNPGAPATTVTGGFTYNPAPTISGVVPAVGSIKGGTAVAINGTGFLAGAVVTFGGSVATVTALSATQISAVTGPHAAGTVDVVVTNPDTGFGKLSGGYTYGLPPVITGIVPGVGTTAGGTTVTITGSEFQPGATVSFGGVAGTVISVSADTTTITATTPAHAAGTVDVTVSNPVGSPFTTTLSLGYSYVAPVSISSVSPNNGPTGGGTAVTIVGTGFQTSGALIYFGGTLATGITVLDSAHLTCTTPAHSAGAVSVTITNPDESTFTLASAYTYNAAAVLAISSVAPTSGSTAGGTVVTIIGSGFQASATVTFGLVAGTSVSVDPTGTQITVTTPAQAAGAVDVTVTNPGPPVASVTQAGAFTYADAPPSITSISPASGPITGGTLVTITGTGFLTGATVTIGVAATVTTLTSTQITALTAAHAAATDDVTVTNLDGQTSTLAGAFTYVPTTLQIVTDGLPIGNPTAPYYATLTPSGGTPPYTWSIVAGALPAGLSLSCYPAAAPCTTSTTGAIFGTPSATTATPTPTFTVQLTDSTVPTAQTIQKPLKIVIGTPPVGALPAVFVDTTFPDTSSYTVVHLAAGGSLQAAINSASCNPTGTVIALAAGATFSNGGGFALPAQTCAPGQWIIIRTDVPDSALPPPDTAAGPGGRIDPSYSTSVPLAKILAGGTGAIIFTNANANHYWFMGVEIGPAPSLSSENFLFIELDAGSGVAAASLSQVPDHIYFDRCYIHGTPTGQNRQGIQANGSYVAIVNSYFADFHVLGADSQAINAINGNGPIKIVNNFLEASTEVILFGGADPKIPNATPADIEIRRNHFFKPLKWKSDDTSFAGILWQIKNLLEFKNAQRVLVEGNVFEYNWLQAQPGFAVLFTPRNQNTKCPWCTVGDVNFRYNIVRHSGSGITISSEDTTNPPSGPGHNIDIHDVLLTDINGPAWGGADGRMMLLSNGNPGVTSAAILPLTNIRVNHLTSFQSGTIVFMGDSLVNPMPNFVFTNNLAPHHAYGIFGSSGGSGTLGIAKYFTAAVVTDNLFVGLPSGTKLTDYPPGNLTTTDFTSVGFVDFAGGDYRLAPTSPFVGLGIDATTGLPDGSNIGADISAVNAATAGAIAPNDAHN